LEYGWDLFDDKVHLQKLMFGVMKMYFTDEKDYIMRMIKERVLFSLVFGKKYVSVELEKENKYEVSGKKLKSFLDMIDLGQINEAENILLDNIDYTNKEEVMAAALFYQYLSEKDNEFLENNNYTKEEVLSGFKQLLIQSGYKELFYLIKDDNEW
jgi:hypothetical protein